MRLIAIVLYTAVLIMLISTYTRARKREGTLAKYVRYVMGVGAIITSVYLILFFSMNYIFSSILYSIYFISMDWLCITLVKYALIYTDSPKQYPFITKIITIILLLDNISLAANVKFEHVVSYDTRDWNGVQWLDMNPKPLFSAHLFICYILLLLCFCILIFASRRSPKIYRAKYLYVMGGLLMAAVINGFFVYTKLMFDISVLSYGFAAIVFYTYTFEYLPRRLAMRASSVMVHYYPDEILVFDMDGICINVNENAMKTFGLEDKIVKLFDFCKEYHICKEEDLKHRFTLERRIATKTGENEYRVEYNLLTDEKKRCIGYYILLHDMTEEIKIKEREWYLITHDRLTGLYNREYFYEQTQKMLEQNPGRDFVMICSNIGQFKLVNEFFDTEFGNNILKEIGINIRKSAAKTAVYGRLDSDRFAVCMLADEYEEKYLTYDKGKINVGDIHNFTFTNYFGVYFIEDRQASISSMCDMAMTAIDSIKDDYSKNVAYYNKKIHDEFVEEQSIIADFAEALEKEEFVIYIQPQISLRTGKCESGEVLVRWNHGEEGMISPGKFIPVFEKNGMIAKLDLYIWEKACQLLNQWEKEGKSHMSLSVNISPKDFYYMDIDQELIRLVNKYQIDPKGLNLELTESAFVHEQEQMLELLGRLQKFGFAIEMDDFGSGYSSLNTLKDIPVNVLKIDMGFFSNTDAASRSRKIVEMVVQLGKSLGIQVIAEGVETEDKVRFLKEIGCDMIQGYFFAGPMPVEIFDQTYC